MKSASIVLLLLFVSFNAQSYSNFIANPYTPYPPGCATLPDLQSALYGDNAIQFYEGDISLPYVYGPGDTPVHLVMYRVICAEPDRSVIWLQFSIPDFVSPIGTYYRLPAVYALRTVWDYDYRLMRLSEEPGNWGGTESSGSELIFGGFAGIPDPDARDRKWTFVLDNASPQSVTGDDDGALEVQGPVAYMTPEDYNAEFLLEIPLDDFTSWQLEIPSTASLVGNVPAIPLSGRLSGNWVFDHASDQGVALSISELVGDSSHYPLSLDDSVLEIFLSWFTYNLNGDLLWLSGAASFNMGEGQVVIPIEQVSNGQFLTEKVAARRIVGSVTITANSCNDLTFQYDLDDIGLGGGTRQLHRLFSLETAGYACRDLDARIADK